MFRRVRAAGYASAAVLVGLWVAGSCHAGTVFTLGNNPQPTEENILFGAKETGTTITGFTNTSNLPVVFSSSQTLTQGASGQADVGAINPATTAAVPAP